MNRRLTRFREWLREPSLVTNGNQIATWTLLIGISFGGIWGFASNVNQREESRDDSTCTARVEGRKDIRAVIIDIYNFIELTGPNPEVQELRARLDLILPELTMQECLEAL